MLCDPVSHDTPMCGWRLLLSLPNSAETETIPSWRTDPSNLLRTPSVEALMDSNLVTPFAEMAFPSFSIDGWHDRANRHAISKVKPI